MKITDIITEAANPAQQAAIAISMKKAGKKPKQGVAEGASSIEQKIIKLYKQGLSDDEIASRLKIDSDDVKSVLDDYEWVTDTTGELKGVAEGKADYNFDIEDLKRLEQIRDLATLKAQALALISKPSAKPMKPEKVEWFKNALERMNSPLKVIKLMYDLLLSGEGKAVVGTKSSMNPNSYRQRFGEQSMAEDKELAEEFDLIESIVEMIAEHNGVDAEAVWEDLESLTEDELYVFAVTSDPLMEDWQKANKRDKTDGMSQKAVNAYRRENPGSKLKTAVTTKPSKLKKGGKASKRRKSYCSRSRGQMKMHSISCAKTPDKAICKARRRWNC